MINSTRIRNAFLAIATMLLIFSGDFSPVSSHLSSKAPMLSMQSTGDAEIWPMNGSFVYEAATTVADIEGDGKKEVIVGSRSLNPDGTLACSGKIYVYRTDGSLKWEKVVRAGVNSSPAVADINGDQIKDVIAGMGAWHNREIKPEDGFSECGIGSPNAYGNGGVVALDGRNGNQLWVFNTQDWGEWGGVGGTGTHGASNGVLDGVFSSPVIGDITGNGEPEIVFGSWDNCIYMVNKHGVPLWDRVPFDYSNPEAGIDFCGGHGFFNHDTVWSSPALADLTGDGQLEIVIGGDISCDVYGDPDLCNRYMEPNGGHLWVIKADGTALARRWMDQAIQSSPAIADLDNDGVLDIVVGTGQAFANKGYYVTAWTLDRSLPVTESLVQKWKADVVGRTFSSPALGDLDGDGITDVVMIIKYGDWGTPIGPNPDNGSYAYAFRGSDGAVMWKTHICNNDAIGRSFPVNAPSILADITGDKRPEVFFPHAWEVGVLNPDGTYYSRVNTINGCTDTTGDVLYNGSGSFTASVAVDDLDNDGTLDLVAPGRLNEERGSLQGGIHVWFGHPKGQLPWAMFQYDPAHTGLYPLSPELKASTSSLSFMHDIEAQDSTLSVSFSLENPGSEEIDWYARTSCPHMDLSPSDGVLSDESTINVEIAVCEYDAGVHEFEIEIRGYIDNEEAPGSPVTIPVRLYVGDISKVYLPLGIRH